MSLLPVACAVQSLAGRDIAGLPQPLVVVDARRIGIDAVGVQQLVAPRRRSSSRTATASPRRGRPTGRRRRGRRDRRDRGTVRRRRSACWARTRRRGTPPAGRSAARGVGGHPGRQAAERAVVDRQRVVQQPQARTDGPGRGPRVGHPARVDRRAAGQPGGVQPAVAGAEHARHPHVTDAPSAAARPRRPE